MGLDGGGWFVGKARLRGFTINWSQMWFTVASAIPPLRSFRLRRSSSRYGPSRSARSWARERRICFGPRRSSISCLQKWTARISSGNRSHKSAIATDLPIPAGAQSQKNWLPLFCNHSSNAPTTAARVPFRYLLMRSSSSSVMLKAQRNSVSGRASALASSRSFCSASVITGLATSSTKNVLLGEARNVAYWEMYTFAIWMHIPGLHMRSDTLCSFLKSLLKW
mmetsp:Transcript_7325/g.11545  ORF Transcript_7325/g.11545 Transcript_7325/m.11545 type:complete len:223 (+) Transcript_7325:1543-2211(+)